MNEKEMKIGHEFAALWLNICKMVSFQPLFDFLQKKCANVFLNMAFWASLYKPREGSTSHLMYYKSLNNFALCQEQNLF